MTELLIRKNKAGIGCDAIRVLCRDFKEGHGKPHFGDMMPRFELGTSQIQVNIGYIVWQFTKQYIFSLPSIINPLLYNKGCYMFRPLLRHIIRHCSTILRDYGP